ncbi:glycosyltransferase [Cohnella sp. CFH 77786]|uniref:glycosyltransferase family 2 protein n=1 Tax=Cohnella sp. CFH 77786 TaxID=2662265 RepID=UPI001C60A819|nr:glycosyltransferase family A protein [Cohnella sp. CFH 77786]MBW5445893.1 glycosyltransferase [Cohnella sp. CFH 77786]
MPIEHRSPYTVSVIIPTYNAGPETETLLKSLWNQTLPPHEIIVIDSSSTDGTAERARKNGAKVYVIDQSDFDHGGTRNYAVTMASGEILVFMTQDAVPNHERMLEELTKPLLENPKIGCAYGRQIAKSDANVLERLSRLHNYPEHSYLKDQNNIPRMGIKTFFCSNVCSAIRKDTFIQLGRFPEPVIFNEDLFFAAKCVLSGYAVAYVAEAEVLHSHNYSLKQQFKRYFDNGVSMRMNEWIYPFSSVGREGSHLLKMQFRKLMRSRAWNWIPALLVDSAAKFIGYQLGKNYRKLPQFLTMRFSMHRRILIKLQSVNGNGMSMKG